MQIKYLEKVTSWDEKGLRLGIKLLHHWQCVNSFFFKKNWQYTKTHLNNKCQVWSIFAKWETKSLTKTWCDFKENKEMSIIIQRIKDNHRKYLGWKFSFWEFTY